MQLVGRGCDHSDTVAHEERVRERDFMEGMAGTNVGYITITACTASAETHVSLRSIRRDQTVWRFQALFICFVSADGNTVMVITSGFP